MFERIVVPLDGSRSSEMAALAPAAALAKKFGSELILVRTVAASALAGGYHPLTEMREFEEAEKYFDKLEAKLKEDGIKIKITLPNDEPASGIVDTIDAYTPDLVVMYTHGRKGLDDLRSPSITWDVLEHTLVPILTWKHSQPDDTNQIDYRDAALPPFLNNQDAPILVPLDGSPLAESVLPLATDLARELRHKILLVRALEHPMIYGGTMDYTQILLEAEDLAMKEADSYLKRKALELKSMGVEAEISSGFEVAEEYIQEVAREYQAGLVVMASHGRHGLGRVVFGSVARGLLSRLDIPILMMRARHSL